MMRYLFEKWLVHTVQMFCENGVWANVNGLSRREVKNIYLSQSWFKFGHVLKKIKNPWFVNNHSIVFCIHSQGSWKSENTERNIKNTVQGQGRSQRSKSDEAKRGELGWCDGVRSYLGIVIGVETRVFRALPGSFDSLLPRELRWPEGSGQIIFQEMSDEATASSASAWLRPSNCAIGVMLLPSEPWPVWPLLIFINAKVSQWKKPRIQKVSEKRL